MQYKAALHLHRTTKHHRRARQQRYMRTDFQREIKPLEEHIHGHVGGTIDDDTQRAAHMMFADINHGAAEYGIKHGGHGNQEMIRQVQSVCVV